jgi:hypothetical protein
MRYDATTLTQTAVFNSTPNGAQNGRAGIWMAGGAPALDSEGDMFFSTGNGAFDATNNSVTPPAMPPNNDFGESFLNLSPSTLAVRDFYTPSQNQNWSENDQDISGGGVIVLPDGTGPAAHPNLLVGTDKLGHIWLIDRSKMSGYVPGADNTVQFLTLPFAAAYSVHGTPAYWNGYIYTGVGGAPIMALQLTGGLIPSHNGTVVPASESGETYNFPNPSPVISASPSGNAILWALDNDANGTDNGSATLGPAILRAYNATNLGDTLYTSSARSADTAGNASKFIPPVVANGHVYVVGNGSLTVYGLAP